MSDVKLSGAAVISSLIRGSADYGELVRSMKPAKPLSVSGITDSANPLFVATLAADMMTEGSPVVICKEEKVCRTVAAAIEALGVRAEHFPARDYNFNNITASREFEHERLRVLSLLAGGERFVVLTTPQALL
ncbi:MAG: hypothetical protein E7578_09045, partial [Ruminococcaceae bacterium]|nr:hypothetical protein [Oscillospiraceae bacterium]